MSALQCWHVSTCINSSSDLTAKFLSAAPHKNLFCKIMDRAMDGHTLLIEDNYCFNGHDLKTLIVRRFFNCIAKNLVRKLTTKANQNTSDVSRRRVSTSQGIRTGISSDAGSRSWKIKISFFLTSSGCAWVHSGEGEVAGRMSPHGVGVPIFTPEQQRWLDEMMPTWANRRWMNCAADRH